MNRFKNQLLMAAGFGLLCSIIGAVTAAPAIAQAVKAALIQDADNPARHVATFAFYDGASYTVPAGQTLVIEEVSGLIGNSLVVIYIDPSSLANRGAFYFSGSIASQGVSEHTRIYVRGGQTFTVNQSLPGGNPGGALISLHGYTIAN